MRLRSSEELLRSPLALLFGEPSPDGIQGEENVVYVLGRKLFFLGLLLAWPSLGHRVSPFVEGFRFQASGLYSGGTCAHALRSAKSPLVSVIHLARVFSIPSLKPEACCLMPPIRSYPRTAR